MANSGGISWSGRALRFVLWRAPLRATQYTVAGYMATMQDVGRRGSALTGFGLMVFGIWWVAGWTGVQGFQEVAAFLVLVWFWRFFVFCRWVYGLRVAASRARAWQRQQMELLQKIGTGIREGGSLALDQTAGRVFTMMGSARHHDPVRQETERMAREQAEQVAEWAPPAGEGFEPVFRRPKFRRRKRKEPDDA